MTRVRSGSRLRMPSLDGFERRPWMLTSLVLAPILAAGVWAVLQQLEVESIWKAIAAGSPPCCPCLFPRCEHGSTGGGGASNASQSAFGSGRREDRVCAI